MICKRVVSNFIFKLAHLFAVTWLQVLLYYTNNSIKFNYVCPQFNGLNIVNKVV